MTGVSQATFKTHVVGKVPFTVWLLEGENKHVVEFLFSSKITRVRIPEVSCVSTSFEHLSLLPLVTAHRANLCKC